MIDSTQGATRLGAGILTADATGRAMMASSFFNSEATFDDKVATGAIGEDRLAANQVTGRVDANLATKSAGALADTDFGHEVIIALDIPAGTTGDVDFTSTPYKMRIVDAWLVKTAAAGGGAGTVQVKNTADAITNAMSIDVADQSITRASTIDDAFHTIASGGTIRVTRTRTASSDESCIVYLRAIRSA